MPDREYLDNLKPDWAWLETQLELSFDGRPDHYGEEHRTRREILEAILWLKQQVEELKRRPTFDPRFLDRDLP